MILFKRISYLIIFVLLFSFYEIKAGIVTIKNNTSIELKVQVSHWGLSGHVVNNNYTIESKQFKKHNLVLDRLAKVQVEGVLGGKYWDPITTHKEWKNKLSSSENRTITISQKYNVNKDEYSLKIK